MNKLKASLDPELAKFVKENFPVIRKKTPLWFFSNEIRNNLTLSDDIKPVRQVAAQTCPNSGQDPGSAPIKVTNVAPPMFSRKMIFHLWRNMDPESKRKYFNMAEFDEVCFKEQRSIWIAELVTLLKKYGSLKHALKELPSQERLQEEFFASLDSRQKLYEQMIQTESTKMLYKEAIRKASEQSVNSGELMMAVPKQQRAILTKPRKPPPSYVLFYKDNADRCNKMRRDSGMKEPLFQVVAKEWATLDQETKKIYGERYDKLKAEYDRAMDAYKVEYLNCEDSYLQAALREKRAFTRSLNKRLRASSILPVYIRNAFNFFVMDKKDPKLTNLSEAWREMPAEQKERYEKMHQEDMKRYEREIEAYNLMRNSLAKIWYKRKCIRV